MVAKSSSKKRANKKRISKKQFKTGSRSISKRKTSRRRSNGRSKYDGMSTLEKKCKMYLQRKIKKNVKEYEDGKYVSRQQAVAVSYSQTKKKYPDCERVFLYPRD